MACVVGGVHEVLVGVDTATVDATLEFFAQFGFRAAQEGQLDAAGVAALYGHRGALQSVLLAHGDADHGLVRLQCWDEPAGTGLGLTSFRVEGTRWGAQLTRSVLEVVNHVEAAQKQGARLTMVAPIFATIYQKDQEVRPFDAPLVGVREMNLIRPLTRQVLFERFGYENEPYGTIDETSMFRASQITHAGMVVRGPHSMLEFYDRVLGLFRAADQEVPYENTVGSRAMFELSPGETHWLIDFDDPRNATVPWQQRRSGRLKILRFEPSSEMRDLRHRAVAGELGYGPYTLRIDDLGAMRVRVLDNGASEVSDIVPDEFDVASFAMRAPDGYQWILRQA